MSLCLVVLLAPTTIAVRWAETTVLSTQGFVAAVGDLPDDPSVQAEVAQQLRQPLAAAAALLPEPIPTLVNDDGVAAAVATVMHSQSFNSLWLTALRTAHHQLLLILRHDTRTVSLSGAHLQVEVPLATKELLETAGLPSTLVRFLPSTIPVVITVVTVGALSQASLAVRLVDALNQTLPWIVLTLAAVGLLAARRRLRVAMVLFSATAAAACALLEAVVWGTHSATGAASVTAVALDLTRPLVHRLSAAAVIGLAAACTIASATWLRRHRSSGSPRRGRPAEPDV